MTYYQKVDPYVALDTLEGVKKATVDHWNEGKNIQRHYKRLEDGYSDWEDRLIAIENAISALEQKHNLRREELMQEPDEKVEFNLEDFVQD